MLKLFVIKNQGHEKTLATYYAKNARAALARFEQEQSQMASSFRRSLIPITSKNLIAVEIDPSA